MMLKRFATLAGATALAAFVGQAVLAQNAAPPPAIQATAPAPVPADQLDQLLAPIALYPDPLLAQILMAATYPLEVVQADRWLQNPGNAALRGDQLTAALAQTSWDPSVKSLVPFPRILSMMDNNLDWTERLGDAFLADQGATMDSVQRLRKRAQAAGNLRSTSQVVVATEGDAVTIAPAMPEVVYVPVYDPWTIYGVWPYPGFPPYYFPDFFAGFVIGSFGFGWWGVPLIEPLWGWGRWDWGSHRIFINRDRFSALNRGRPPIGGGAWEHDPAHRSGVPYRDSGLRGRFGGSAAPDANRGFRGYPTGGGEQVHAGREQFTAPRVPPTFESFGRGPDTRFEAERGYSSRTSAPHLESRGSMPSGGGRGHR